VNIFKTKVQKNSRKHPAKPETLPVRHAPDEGDFSGRQRLKRTFLAKRYILRQIVCPHTVRLDDF
jgi:hypothetical protein